MLQVTTLTRWIIGVALAGTACSCELGASAVCVRVSDYADLPLHDAWVTVTDLQTNKVFNTRTGRNGDACASQIPEGLYSVEVGMTGFLNVRYYPVRITSLATQELMFRLPFGEITEGGIAKDAILSGTLRQNDQTIAGATICALSPERDLPITCGVTNDLGEYALSLVPGSYRIEVRVRGEAVQRTSIEISAPGIYRNRVVVPPAKDKKR